MVDYFYYNGKNVAKYSQSFGGGIMKKNNLILIIVIAVLVLVIVAGAVLYFTVLSKPKAAEPVVKIDANIMSYAFESSFVNNINGSTKIIKVTIELEINKKNEKKMAEILAYKNAEMLDKINYIIRSKTEQELTGPEGQLALKKDILEALREILGKERVVNVFFKEYIMQ